MNAVRTVVVHAARRAVALLVFVATAAVAQIDERTLVLDNGRDGPVALPVTQLVEQYELQTLTIDDIEYKAPHTYLGLDLKTLLTKGGFRPGALLLLVCTDGYSIPFDSNVLLSNEWQGLLALRDQAATGNNYFVPFDHGGEKVDFAPFYLVWSPLNGATSTTTASDLPWPYQLTQIRMLQPADYQSAMPPADAPATVQAGFDLYFKQCIKCHSVNGSGGTLGKPLDKANGLAALLASGTVRDDIINISTRYPLTKMPVYGDSFRAEQLDALVSYLRWVAQ
jgi:mono/diheme cytochrome c family protein